MHEQPQSHSQDNPPSPSTASPTPTLENPIFSPVPYSPSRLDTSVYYFDSHSLDPRPRTAAPQHRIRPASDFVRSDFWFHDGNIVIVAGPSAFKVHRGQLERHSEVFLGLFALPQPPLQDQDLVDGCPSVEFYDSPADIFYFLSALYDGLYFKYPRANDFPAIAAVLRLATKYMVEPLRIRCLHRLHLDWPPTIHGWDQREAAATDEAGRYLPRETCPHPILVIHLALEMGIPTILPAAFYDLSRYGPSKILAGARKPLAAYDIIVGNRSNEQPECSKPETTAPPTPASMSPSASTNFAPIDTHVLDTSFDPVQLSHAFLYKTLRGREASQRYIATFLSKELANRQPAADCLNKHNSILQVQCTESFYYILLNILRSVGGIACGRDADPLFTLVQALEMLSRTDFTTADGAVGDSGEGGSGERGSEPKKCGLRMCTMCKVDFAKAVTRAREEVWGLLPTWFEIV